MDSEFKNKFISNFKKRIMFPVVISILLSLLVKVVTVETADLIVRVIGIVLGCFVLYGLFCAYLSGKKEKQVKIKKPRRVKEKPAKKVIVEQPHVEQSAVELVSVETPVVEQPVVEEVNVKKEIKAPMPKLKIKLPKPKMDKDISNPKASVDLIRKAQMDMDIIKRKMPKFSESSKPDFDIGSTKVDFDTDDLNKKVKMAKKQESITDIDSCRLFDIAKHPETITPQELKLITENQDIKSRYEVFLKKISDTFDKNKNLYYLKRL